MSVAPPADPRDVQDFQFKLLCRLRVFSGDNGTFKNAVNLIATTSKYGLIFVGCPTGLQVIKSSSIIGLEHPNNSGGEISNYPRREILLPSQPTHLSISCDQNYLVAAVLKDGCAHGLIYSVASFMAKDIALASEVRFSSKPDTSVLELTWNPGIPNVLVACLSDGSMAAYELKPTGLEISTLPPATQATSFCWSPKGKQLVVGTESGTLTQYKPDLKAVKTIEAPNLGSGSVAVVNVLWISNYQFAAVYRDKGNPDERPGLLIVNAPKAGAVSFVNYEDICYSGGDLRNPQFYLIHQPTWNVLMVASANSMEVGVLGLQEDQISWEQWTQEDAARAELPLSADKQETFPVGMGLDLSTHHELPWGENQSLPPMPVLNILSHQGVLCLFYAVNLRPNAPCICSPPEKLPDESGLSFFTTGPSLPVIEQSQESAQPHGLPKEPQSGFALGSGNSSLGSLRVSSAPKFDNVSIPQLSIGGNAPVPSLFGQGKGLLGSPSAPFGTGLGSTPTIGFGSLLASTTSAPSPSIFSSGIPASTTVSFSAGTATTPSFGTSLLGTSTGFGSASGFGAPLNVPPTTTTTNISQPSLGAPNTNPPSLNFSAGLGGQLSSGLGSGLSNTPSLMFGTGLGLSGAIPTSKSAFTFQTPTTAASAATTILKPPAVQSSSTFSFTSPGAASTPQQTLRPSSPQTSLLPPPQTTAVPKPQMNFFGSSAPVLQITEPSLNSAMNHPKPTVPTQQVKVDPVPESKQTTSSGVPPRTSSLPEVDNTVLFNAINDEVTHFEKELEDLRSRVNGINVKVGTEEEKKILHKKVDSMEEFWRELKETTQAQSLEIHNLKSELMESFAYTEEAKSRLQQLNSPMYLKLTRSQTLDPITARHANNIKQLVYYVENQLRQVNERLDCIWLEFKESCKPSVKNKMHIPTLEAVYQAMVVQNNILNKQRAMMADIARRAQEQGKNTQIPLISTAVLARVRDKEASQLGKGETELSRLAENLVQLKLGPTDVNMNHNCRHLSRKKESLLRELLSQSTVTRICPTKPTRTTLDGILKSRPVDISVNITSKPSQAPIFLFAGNKVAGDVETISTSPTNSFSVTSVKSPGKTPPTMSKLSGPTEAPDAEPNISDTSIAPGSKSNDMLSKGSSAGKFVFGSPLQSGKASVPENFSFSTALSKTPSFGKINEATKKLEDYYEEITPPGTPDHSSHESASSVVNSAPSTSVTFSFISSNKLTTAPPSSLIGTSSSPQNSPLLSLDSIVAGIGDGSTTIKPVSKPADTKTLNTFSLGGTGGGGAFSFGSLSLGQSQQVNLSGKSEEPKKPVDTFKFSLPASTGSTTAAPVDSSDATQVPPLKAPATTTGITIKTPLFSSFGTDSRQPNTGTTNMFGGGETQKPSLQFAATGSSTVSSSSSNIFSQAASSMFAGINSSSPAKQQFSGNLFGGTPTSAPSMMFGKPNAETTQATAVTASSAETQKQETESPQKDSSQVVTSSDSIFSQSASLFGNLSMGTAGGSSKQTGNIFGGNSGVFNFGKQTIPPDSSSVSTTEITSPETTEPQVQKSDSPAKDPQPPPIAKPVSVVFGQSTPVTKEDKAETSEATSGLPTLSTSSIFGGKLESSSGASFSFGQIPSTTTQTSIFGQPAEATKPLAGSLFGTPTVTSAVTPAVTQQQADTPVATSAATAQTTEATSSTFSFSLPVSTQSSSIFGQKPNAFGQPASTAATTTSSSSFFGQPICSPSGFGQNGATIFGQAPTTTAKTNIFGQATATTTTPSVFGQVSSSTSQSVFGQTPAFGQAPSSGSSFLGGGGGGGGSGSAGGFGSKPTFGQPVGSIFGQSGSAGFGSNSGSIFGGSSTSVFGGGTGSPSGNLFQPSSGGSIFGGSTSPNSGTGNAGAFSSGLGSSISQTGFGSPTGFQNKPGGFGGSPVFDRGTSGFGSPPTFGGAPTFGGSPTFGSPGKVFGSTSPASNVTFGTAGQQQSTKFESLATQNTMTFGNLAQNQNQGFGSAAQPVFGGSPQPQAPAPSFTGGSSFGGSSFSSWR